MTSPVRLHRSRRTLIFLLLLLTLSLLAVADSALGATKMLMFNPLRVIFTDRQRSINLHVINQGDEDITYNIGLVTMRQGADGKLHEPAEENEQEKMIKDMVRLSPRRATIAPGQRQVVKLMVRKPQDLPPGEYQTRLALTPLPATTPQTTGGEMINIDVLVTSTLPVIIQHASPPAEVTPLSITLTSRERPTPTAKVTLERSGDLSAFGNLFLELVPADGSGPREIGRSIGLALYQPDSEKTIEVPLRDVQPQELQGATIRVSFEPDTGIVETRRSRQRSKASVSKDLPLR